MSPRKLIALDAATTMKMWPTINSAILFSLPPLAQAVQWSEEKILAAINRGELTLWVYSEGPQILAVLSTTVTGDTITGTRAMLIYSAHSDGGLTTEDWRTIVSTLANAAHVAGFSKLVAYSDVQRVIDIVQELGGNARIRVCELPMPEN